MQLRPAADQVAQNAEPLAERAIAEGVKPAAEAVAKNAEPMAKQFTEGQLQPAAKQVCCCLMLCISRYVQIAGGLLLTALADCFSALPGQL